MNKTMEIKCPICGEIQSEDIFDLTEGDTLDVNSHTIAITAIKHLLWSLNLSLMLGLIKYSNQNKHLNKMVE